MNSSWQKVADNLGDTIGKNIIFTTKTPVFGGDINQAWKVTDAHQQHWFIKTNQPSLLPMFEAEAKGLDEIVQTNTIRAPKHYCSGTTAEFSYLVLEYIELSSLANPAQAGEQLAKMHQFTATTLFNPEQSTLYGWAINNTIGSTPQSNQPHKSWESFYKKERLLFQLNLAKSNNYPTNAYEKGLLLADNLSCFFDRYTPKASLLHGDLWGGNCASDNNGNAVIFDPAVYFGDRETDLAMTELFGGFGADFYASYNKHYPLDRDYKTRKNLYNLYHILNHFNLFGGSYASQAENITLRLLAEI